MYYHGHSVPCVSVLGQFESGVTIDACPKDPSESRGSNKRVEAEGRLVVTIARQKSERTRPGVLDPLETPAAQLVDQTREGRLCRSVCHCTPFFWEMFCQRSDIEWTAAQ